MNIKIPLTKIVRITAIILYYTILITCMYNLTDILGFTTAVSILILILTLETRLLFVIMDAIDKKEANSERTTITPTN